jgi:hypothetical protein
MLKPSGTATLVLDPALWQRLKDRNITFSAVAPATALSGSAEPGVTFVMGIGQVNPVGQGQASFKGGFRLENAGAFVEATDPSGGLPTGKAEFSVRTSANGSASRMKVFDYSVLTALRISPLDLTFGIDRTEAKGSPDFTRILAEAFGEGLIDAGAPFGIGSADFGFKPRSA